MHVHEVLCDDVIGLAREAFIRDRLYFQSEVEIAQVLEGDGRHTDLILFGRYLDDWCVLVRLIEVLNAHYLWNFALGVDRKADWLEAL